MKFSFQKKNKAAVCKYVKKNLFKICKKTKLEKIQEPFCKKQKKSQMGLYHCL